MLRNISKYAILFIITYGLHSCSKKAEQELEVGGETKLVFQKVQISDNQQILKSASIGNNKAQGNLPQANATATSQSNSGFGFSTEVFAEQTSIEAANSLITPHSTQAGPKDFINKSAAVSPMNPGYTYRIMLYNKTTNQLFKTFLARSNQTFEVEVPKGAKFTWYAYSYNDNEDIPEPTNLNNPSIQMSVNKDFLFDSGEIETLQTPSGQLNTYPINIVFDHKVAQLKVKIDASSLAQVANIESFKASFLRNDYLKRGVFSLKGGSISQLEVVPTEVIFNSLAANNIWEKAFYTADPSSIKDYQVNIDDLTVNFFLANPSYSRINLATQNPNNKPRFQYSFTSPAAGQQLTGLANLNYILKSRRIFHVSSAATYGYSLQLGPGWQMINSLKNFGNLPGSLVKMLPYAPGQGVWIGGNAENNTTNNWVIANIAASRTRLLNELQDVANRPDIIISGYNHYAFNNELQDAIVKFVNDGGVYIMLNEFVDPDVPSLLNKLFNTNSITMRPLGSAGSMYPLLQTDNNDRVLNGPFGDARGKFWGEDASTTVGVLGLPTNSAIIYSYGQAVNRIDNVDDERAVTMFKHNTKNFFYLGDGGLVSYNGSDSYTICPFAFDANTARPIPKKYGNAYSPKGYAGGSQYAYNGIIAGNIMLWAAAIAEFNGLRPWKYAP